MDPTLQRAKDIAELVVQRAAMLTRRVLSSVQEISKKDSTPVTIADFAAQAVIISAIRGVFPDDRFVGEEGADVLRRDKALRDQVFELVSSISWAPRNSSEGGIVVPLSVDEMLDVIDLGGQGQGGSRGRFWVMDPVDGTATFLRGEQYAVSLSLIEDGEEVLGVLACPNLKLEDGRIYESSVDTEGLGVMLTAVKGHGANISSLSATGQPLDLRPLPRLKSPSELKGLHMVHCIQSKSMNHGVLKKLAEKLGAEYPGTNLWSSHMRYAAMILGGGDFQVRVPVRVGNESFIWDHAGAQLIYREIGGKITDLDGRKINFGSGRVLGSNNGLVIAPETIHGGVLRLAQELVAEGKTE